MPQPFPPLSELAASSAVVIDNPGVTLAGVLADPEYPTDPMDFFERFGVRYDTVKAEGYTPLFLAITHSSSGEEAESFGLFEKSGKKGPQYFEVLGSECSVWDFNGQWEPELTTPAVLWHRLTHGQLGLADGNDAFNTSLKAVVAKLDPTFADTDAPTPAKGKKAKKRRPR